MTAPPVFHRSDLVELNGERRAAATDGLTALCRADAGGRPIAETATAPRH